MKIATHNIEFLFEEGMHTHSGKEWNYTKELVEARVSYFSKLFSEINADILLLQEIASKSVIERIIARTGIDYSYFFGAPDQNGVGNVVLYKQKDASCESIPALTSLPVFVEGDGDVLGSRIWSRRDFVHMELIWNGKKLHIVDVHIKANFLMPEKNTQGEAMVMTTQITAADGLIRSEIFRFSQAKKLRELIDTFFVIDPDALVVVGGDYNAEENYAVYRIIRGVINDAPDTLVEAGAKIEQEKRFSSLSKTLGRNRLLDHFLISKSLEPRLIGVQILNDNISENNNTAPSPNLVGSDHAPIVIELK
ncbi:MAG: endonuclease/exonuclease/phosphatase family protein [Candidatus Pacebacteria bacterium]|nr:endonuclease/exonuclease/phosphatase family protein [Candidatus Paceibacterota bacterium]